MTFNNFIPPDHYKTTMPFTFTKVEFLKMNKRPENNQTKWYCYLKRLVFNSMVENGILKSESSQYWKYSFVVCIR